MARATKSAPTQGPDGPVRAPPFGPAPTAVPVVGIGASAGGLAALEGFLRHVPAASGLAFVVIQHLDPTREGMLVELLQRGTAMSVCQVTDGMEVLADHVYVIPPNADLSILHDAFHLLEPSDRRGMRLPVDFFLLSLAADRKEHGIGVVLSGMGSDGTKGLRALKAKGGLTCAQDPKEAGFDSMPRSAIDAGVADVVAPVEELADRILAWLHRRPSCTQRPNPIFEPMSEGAMEKVIILMRHHTGNDLSMYKRGTLLRRIHRRLGVHGIDDVGQYVRCLRENPHELDLLFKELLIGVTSFFRDPQVWDRLAAEILPALLATPREVPGLRAWVPGCSTGEEAYTLAMVYREAVDSLAPDAPRPSLQIFATDLDPDAVEVGRRGVFPVKIAEDLSPARLQRFFIQEESGYRVAPEIRSMVVFAPQNVLMDPPFSRLDLLSCRNLLIYLTHEAQKRLLPLFHYVLRPGGVLVLGTAETPTPFPHLFESLDDKLRIFRRRDWVSRSPALEFPSMYSAQRPKREDNPMKRSTESLEAAAERLILRSHSPAAVLVNGEGDILYTSARTGRYLEPSVGKANLNIFVMAREGLRAALVDALQKAQREGSVVTVRGVQVGTNGGTQWVDLTVQPVLGPDPLQGTVLIVISDIPAPRTRGHEPAASSSEDASRIIELEAEATRLAEERQASREELCAANEELQSSNEELQSTNEELQSLNEELQTVNAELQSKLTDLSRANSDMTNLLNSTEIGTIFLDRDLNVRRFTDKATKVFKLIPSDVGRPLSDLVSNLAYPGLPEDARSVLATLVYKEALVEDGDGRRFRVRIMPYRTLEDLIDGLVITFIDVTVDPGQGTRG